MIPTANQLLLFEDEETDMAMTPEARVKKRVREILDKFCAANPGYYFFPPANGYGRQGIPDVICCIQGKFLAIECKANGGVPTELQNREAFKIQKAGGVTLLIDERTLPKLEAYLILIKGKQS